MEVKKEMEEKLKDFKYTTESGNYISERTKIDQGIYGFRIFLGEKVIFEEAEIKIKNGKELQKYIKKLIRSYEKNLETEEEKEALADLKEEAELDEELDEIDEITEVIEEAQEIADEKLETEEIEEKETMEDVSQDISNIFERRKTSPEMQKLFTILNTEIMKIDDVKFRTTTLDLVYNINGRGFLRIRAIPKCLVLMTAPEYYKDIMKITEVKEIKKSMVLIKESYDLNKKKGKKKRTKK